jgi:hypothetical protein
MTGETQARFFLRAFRALRTQFPSVNRRTLEILRLWRDSASDRDLRDKALAMFPAGKFVRFGPRCIFVEHTVPASDDGERPAITYGQAELQQLVDWANYRIRNSENFAVISDGHTPSQDERTGGALMPNTLGYAGPFYLGLFGDVHPQWAIYADEWAHQDDVPRFEKLQRRSPEVWAGEPMERRTLDPIAALGAETPRLDCGMNPYTRAGDGQRVMRYSAATLPGPTNVFIPSARRRTRQRYSGDPLMPSPGADSANPDLATAIGNVLQTMLPNIVQSVLGQLQGDPTASRPTSDLDESLEDLDTDTDEVLDDDSDPSLEQVDDEPIGTDNDDDSEPDRYGARQVPPRPRMSDDLAVIVARQDRQIRQLKEQMQRERRDVQRYARLNDLAGDYAFDPHEEFETCQEMSDRQFDRHCERTVTRYARRDDVTHLDLPDDLEPERYTRQAGRRITPDQVERFSREAAAIAARKNAARRGSTTFETEFDTLCQSHGVSAGDSHT